MAVRTSLNLPILKKNQHIHKLAKWVKYIAQNHNFRGSSPHTLILTPTCFYMSFHYVSVAELVNYIAHNPIVRDLSHDLLTVRKKSNVVSGWLDDRLCFEGFPEGNCVSLFWHTLQSWDMLEYSTSLALLLLLLLQLLLNYYIHCYAVAVWVKHMANAPIVGDSIPHLLTMKAIGSQSH